MIERNRKSQVKRRTQQNRREDGSTRAHAATASAATAIAVKLAHRKRVMMQCCMIEYEEAKRSRRSMRSGRGKGDRCCVDYCSIAAQMLRFVQRCREL